MEVENFQIFSCWSSNDESSFSVLTSDKFLKWWNTLNSKVRQVNLSEGMDAAPSCIDFHRNHVAIGTSNGKIILFDTSRMQIITALEGHSSRVTSLKFSSDGSYLVSIGSDKQILKWEMTNYNIVYSYQIRKASYLSNMLVVPLDDDCNKVLFTIKNKIKCLDTIENNVSQKYVGHSKLVKLISVSSDSNIFTSFADEGYVNIWSTDQSAPLTTIALHYSVQPTAINLSKIDKKHYLLTTSHSNQINSFFMSMAKKSGNIHVEQTRKYNATNTSFISARLLPQNQDKVVFLQIAYGDTTKPVFQRISLCELDGTDGKANLITNQKFNQELVVPLNKSQKMTDEKSMSTAQVNYQVPNEMEAQGFNTIHEDMKVKGQFEVETTDEFDGTGQRKELNSLAILLEQSLQNNDTKIIDYCLDTSDVTIINNSVAQLRKKKIVSLLDRLIERIHTYPYKLGTQLKWLNAILSHQSLQLLQDPQITTKIGPLIALLEKRTTVYESLKGFQAKLSLLLLIKKQQRNQPSQGLAIDRKNAKPLVTVEERPMKVVMEEERPKIPQYAPAEEKEPEFEDSISDSEEDRNEEFDEEEDADNEFDQMLAAKKFGISDDEDEVSGKKNLLSHSDDEDNDEQGYIGFKTRQ